MVLPIDAVLPDLIRVLRAGNAVLEAPPGAGKTTRVPVALLAEPWLNGKIVMLEPRRLATRGAARFMARLLGEKPGERIGYRMRGDSAIGPGTRVEVVTEGVFTRLIQDDPSLPGIGLVIFDEFHERSLDADLGLALALDAQNALRPDLRLLVMSATLDGARIADLIKAKRVTSEGRQYPIETRYVARKPGEWIEDGVAAVVRRALGDDGDVLAFLPGAREIARVRERLDPPADVTVHVLHGDLPPAAQDAALAPAPAGTRKIVLASAIAETSLTIEGVRIVVDSGLARVPRFDLASGLTALETVRVTRATADQRRGRAGRLGPGICWRLWAEPENLSFQAQITPEILAADLTPLALELALWGGEPAWLDPPPAAAMAQARTLLAELGALGADGRITAHGRAMVGPTHPRLAHMILAAKAAGQGALACDIAAVLGERDILRGTRDCDLRLRLDALKTGRAGDRGATMRVREAARRLRDLFRCRDAGHGDHAGRVLALAYPDRIAQRREDRGSFKLSGGRGAVLDAADPLAGADYLAVASLDGASGRIHLAAPLTLADIEADFADRIIEQRVIAWDAREQAVVARAELRMGEIALKARALAPEPEAAIAAMIAGIRDMGIAALPWTPALRQLQARVDFMHRLDADWPDVGDGHLLATLEDWAAPYLNGIMRRAHLARFDLAAALNALIGHARLRKLERAAPTHLEVPTGSRITIDYSGPEPVLSVKLQEMFGLADTPRVGEGRVPVVVHLLSPAGRPLQVTRDLASFWKNAYVAVRGEMRGRYPRHPWPDDPLSATPTRRAKPR